MDVTKRPTGRALRAHDGTGDSDARPHRPDHGEHLALVTPLSTSIPKRPDLRWSNPLGEEGFIFDPVHLYALICLVGIVDAWTWLTVTDMASGASAQARSAGEELTLQVSVHGNSWDVVAAQAESPRQRGVKPDQGPSPAGTTAVLRPEEVASEMIAWFRTHSTRAGYELRPVAKRTE